MPVFSKRFALAHGNTADVRTVPAGKRWVVKCIVSANTGDRVLAASLDVSGVYVWFRSVPVQATVIDNELQMVFDQGEVLATRVGGDGITVSVGGYELDITA